MKTIKTSVCIPVYNEIQFIEKTIRSALGQADEIVISDNASTDGTSEVCKGYAESNSSIVYTRHSRTRSVLDNFKYVASMASGDYFMLLGGHDLIANNHVRKLRAVLDSNADAVLAYSNAVHLDSDYVFKSSYEYDFTDALSSELASTRVLSMVRDLCDCTIYHGLFRKVDFLSCAETVSMYPHESIDHGFLTAMVTRGKAIHCKGTTYYRINPRTQEGDAFITWTRVLKTVFQEKYDSKVHTPELIPIGIAAVQFLIAQKVAQQLENKEVYLRNIASILIQRWGVNAYASEEIGRIVGTYRPADTSACSLRYGRYLRVLKGYIKRFC